MTNDELRQAAQLMLDAADGVEIECKCKLNNEYALWGPDVLGFWNFEDYEYRRKPKPREGWTLATCLYDHPIPGTIKVREVSEE